MAKNRLSGLIEEGLNRLKGLAEKESPTFFQAMETAHKYTDVVVADIISRPPVKPEDIPISPDIFAVPTEPDEYPKQVPALTSEDFFEIDINSIWSNPSIEPGTKQQLIEQRTKERKRQLYQETSDTLNAMYHHKRMMGEKEAQKGKRLKKYKRSWDRGWGRVASAGLQLAGEFSAVWPQLRILQAADVVPEAQGLKEEARYMHKGIISPEMTSFNDDWVDWVLNTGLDTAPFMITAMAPAALTGGATAPSVIGSFAVSFGVEGNSAYQTALDNGLDEKEARLRGMVVGLVNGGIEVAGGGAAKYYKTLAINKTLSKLAKTKVITKAVLRNALKEGLEEEVPQEVVQMVVGGDIPRKPDGSVNWQDVANRLLSAGAAGTLLGFGGGAITSIRTTLSNEGFGDAAVQEIINNYNYKIQKALERGDEPAAAAIEIAKQYEVDKKTGAGLLPRSKEETERKQADEDLERAVAEMDAEVEAIQREAMEEARSKAAAKAEVEEKKVAEKPKIARPEARRGPEISPKPLETKEVTEEKQIYTEELVLQRGAFEKYKQNIPDATEQEIVRFMIEDGLRPPKAVLDRNSEMPEVQEIFAQDKTEEIARKYAEEQAKPKTKDEFRAKVREEIAKKKAAEKPPPTKHTEEEIEQAQPPAAAEAKGEIISPAIKQPTLTKASLPEGSSEFYVEFDEMGIVPESRDIENFLNENKIGAVARVQRFQRGIVAATKGARMYRIDVYDNQGRLSKNLAKQLFDEKLGVPHNWTSETELQRAIPLEERFKTVVDFAKRKLTGEQPAPAAAEAKGEIDIKALSAKIQTRLIEYTSGKVNTSEQTKLMEKLNANTIGEAYRKAGEIIRGKDENELNKLWNIIAPIEAQPPAPAVEVEETPPETKHTEEEIATTEIDFDKSAIAKIREDGTAYVKCPECGEKFELEECPAPGGMAYNVETCPECGTDIGIIPPEEEGGVTAKKPKEPKSPTEEMPYKPEAPEKMRLIDATVIGEEEAAEREGTISPGCRMRLIKEIESEILEDEIYQSSKEGRDIREAEALTGVIYVDPKYRGEIDRAIQAHPHLKFKISTTDKTRIHWDQAAAQMVDRAGLTQEEPDIETFLDILGETKGKNFPGTKLNIKDLQAYEDSGNPYAEMKGQKLRMLVEGAAPDEINDWIREWAEGYGIEQQVYEDELVGPEAKKIKEIRQMEEGPEKEAQLWALAEKNVLLKERRDAKKAVNEVLAANDLDVEVEEVEKIEPEKVQRDLLGRPVFTPATVGKTKELGIEPGQVTEKEVAITYELSQAVAELANQNITEPKEVAATLMERKGWKELFKNPSNPLPEVRTAIREAIEGRKLPFEIRGEPVGAAITTPAGKEIVLLAYGADSETGYHEGYHILRGHLTNKDIRILDKHFKGDTEREAREFAEYARTGNAKVGYLKGIWRKLVEKLKKIKSALQGRGYRTVRDIFGEIKAGRIAKEGLKATSVQYERSYKSHPKNARTFIAQKRIKLRAENLGFFAQYNGIKKVWEVWTVKDPKAFLREKDKLIYEGRKPEDFLTEAKENPKPYEEWGQVQYETRPVFYSKLERTVSEKMPAKMPATQFENWVKKQGIKQAEQDWLGVTELLSQKTPLTKQQVLDTIAANSIQIEETAKGEETGITREQIERFRELVDLERQGELNVSEESELQSMRWEGVTRDAHEINADIDETARKLNALTGSLYNDIKNNLTDEEELELLQPEHRQGLTSATTRIIDRLHGYSGIDEFNYTFNALKEKRGKLGYKYDWDDIARTADIYFTLQDELNESRRTGPMSKTKFSYYVLPGGYNYRELLLRLPEPTFEPVTELPEGYEIGTDPKEPKETRYHILPPGQIHARPFAGRHSTKKLAIEAAIEKINFNRKSEPGLYQSPHWEETNILAHVRFDDRIDEDGKRVLFIEEIQSDWHQAGRKRGYYGEKEKKRLLEDYKKRVMQNARDIRQVRLDKGAITKETFDLDMKDIEAALDHIIAGPMDTEMRRTQWAWKLLSDATDSRVDLNEVHDIHDYERLTKGVPDAPFKKTWHELALKRMLRYAAENGYDRIAWTTGEQQAERYDLSRHIDSILAVKRENGNYGIFAKKGGERVISREVDEDGLFELVGKDLAGKIIAQKETKKEYTGLDLKVGGSGMKAFYDKMVPAFLNKYAKKWGARVGKTGIQAGTYQRTNNAEEALYQIVELGNIVYGLDSEGNRVEIINEQELDEHTEFEVQAEKPVKVPAIDITEPMKKSVMAGQVQFETSGERMRREAIRRAEIKAEKARLEAMATPKRKKVPLKRFKLNIRDTTPPLSKEMGAQPGAMPGKREPERTKIKVDVKATPKFTRGFDPDVTLDELTAVPVDTKPKKKIYLTDRFYEENIKPIRKRFVEKPADLASRALKSFDKALESSDIRLERIHPILFREIRRYAYDFMNRTVLMVDEVKPFIEGMKRMSKEDFRTLDLALKNAQESKINQLITKYNLWNEYRTFREVEDEIYEAANQVGMDVRYLKDHVFRSLKDPKGFLEYFQRGDDWSIIEEAIKRRAERAGRTIHELTDEEKALVVNTLLRGFRLEGISLSRPGPAKERTVEIIDRDLNQFYDETPEAIIKYIRLMNRKIAEREFFGKETREITDLRKLQSARLTRLLKLQRRRGLREGTTEGKYKDHISKTAENWKAGNERLQRMTNRKPEETIGGYVMDLVTRGDIKPSQEREIRDILQGIFYPRGMGRGMGIFSSAIYIDTLNSPLQALTQLDEFAYSFYRSPTKAVPVAIRTALRQSKITPRDIGITSIGEEFYGPSMQKALALLLKSTGFEMIDRLNKENYINTVLEKYRSQAKKPTASFLRRIQRVFGEDYKKVIEDLKNIKTKEDISEDVKYLLFNEMLDIQPVSVVTMPEYYNKAGKLRILYTLKTFYMKRLSFARKECLEDMKHKETFARGFGKLTWLALSFALLGVGPDFLKAFIRGQKFDLSDSITDNLLRMVFFSKYQAWKTREEGLGTALLEGWRPPTKAIDAITKDIIRAAEGKDRGFEVWRSVPIGGEMYYWWFGEGRRKIEAKEAEQELEIR